MTAFRVILITVLLSFLTIGCDKRPGNVLGEDEMVKLIADMEVAETYFQQHPNGYYNDSVRDRAMQYVLNKHRISKVDFDSTLTWYGKNIDVYEELYEKVEKELLSRQRKITGKREEELLSNDLWPYSRHFMIDGKSGSHDIRFTVPGTEIESGERLIWRLRANSMPTAQMLLGVEYDNGSFSLSYQSISSKIPEVTLQTDSGKKIKKIIGQFRLKDEYSSPVWIDSISLKSLPFDSTEYYKIYSQRLYRLPSRKVLKREEEDSVKKEREDRIEKSGGIPIDTKKNVRRLQPSEINIDNKFKSGKIPEKSNRPRRIKK